MKRLKLSVLIALILIIGFSIPVFGTDEVSEIGQGTFIPASLLNQNLTEKNYND